MSGDALLSVVIPTRDRPETLAHALRTVLAAADAATEVLVHDNSTDDRTVALVERLGDERIRHLRVHDLAMTDNWEAAVLAARGDWITVLGDDDGLMPFATRAVRTAIARTGTDVVTWRKARYCWPDRDRDANKLKIPAARAARWVSGRVQLEAVLAGPRHRYGELPMLYNSFVARSALERIVRRDGRLFGSRSPDVYSGAAIAATTERFLRVGLPLSVNGLSGASNGVNFLTKPAGNAIAADFAGLNARAGLEIHPAVPDVRSLAGAALDSCLAAIDAVAPAVPVDRLRVIRSTLDDAVLFSDAEVEAAREAARVAARGERALERRVERLLGRWDPNIADAGDRSAGVSARIDADGVQVDASRFGISDIAGAVVFAAGHHDESERWLVPAAPGPGLGRRLRHAVGSSRDEFVRALRPGH